MTAGPLTLAVIEQPAVISDDGHALNAELDDEQTVIRLDMNLSAGRKRLSLVHEIFHQLCHYTDIGREIEEKHVESMIVRLSPWWLDVLRRNPQLVAFLMGD